MTNLFGQKFTKSELMKVIGSIPQIGGIKEYTLNSGKAKGVRAYEINTGSLSFTVLPDRCMDISYASFNGTPLSWISKAGVTAPQYFEHKGFEFLRSFYGGMLTTCGLRNTGIPCKCGGEDLGLHGRIANTPSEKVCVNEYWQGDEYIMTVSGQMRESAALGENLLLKREITTKLGDCSFKIKDTVINEGFKPEEVLLLYHMNFGFPIADDGAKIIVPNGKAVPATPKAAKGLECMCNIHEPEQNYEEECFFLDFDDEEIEVGIQNPKLQNIDGIYIKYKKSQLPWFTVWKMLSEGDYVIGLEPGLQYPMGREKAKEKGLTKLLKPFEEYTIEIEAGVKVK